MFFYISLYSGRSDNIYLEADSKNDILDFINTLSDAKVVNIKKVVYSKEYQIGTVSGAFAYETVNTNRNLKVMVKTKNYTNVVDIKFSKENLTREFIETNIKKYLLLNDEKIESIFSVMEL